MADLIPASSPGVESRIVRAEALVLRPAQVHAQKHLSPVLRFGAARAGLDGHDRVQAVAFAGEQRFRFKFRDICIGGGEFLCDVFEKRIALRVVRFFLREMEISLDVARSCVERSSRRSRALRAACAPAAGLRLFLIVPEIGGA